MARTIGIEIEMYIDEGLFEQFLEDIGDNPAAAYGTFTTRFQAIDRILNKIGCTNWASKPDGSLETEQIKGRDVFGVEVITPPLTWEEVKVQIPLFYKTFMKFGTAEDETAGLHVHIDVSDLINVPKSKAGNEELINKLMMLMLHYKSAEPVFDMMVAKHRKDNEFAETVEYKELVRRYAKAIFLLSNKGNLPEIIESLGADRYAKLNILSLHKQPTVEFRQHEGTNNPQKVLLWVSNCLNFINVFNTAEKVFDNFLSDTKKSIQKQQVFPPNQKKELLQSVFQEMNKNIAKRFAYQIRNLVMDATQKNISSNIPQIYNYIQKEMNGKKKEILFKLDPENLSLVQSYYNHPNQKDDYETLRISKTKFTPEGIVFYPFSNKEFLKRVFEAEYKSTLHNSPRVDSLIYPSPSMMQSQSQAARKIASTQQYNPVKQIQEELKLLLQHLK